MFKLQRGIYLVEIFLILIFCSYTWKIYANKVLNMGSIYTFWRTLYKDQKQAKQRYIDTFYNLEFRNLVYFCMPALHSTPNILMRYTFLILLPKLHLLQIKDVPIKIDEKTEGPKERPERVKVKPQLSQRYALELLPTIFQGS